MSRLVNAIFLTGKIFLMLLAVALALGFAELAFNRIRGYQLVTLKTRMYWNDGKAIAGEKVKTWKLAIPVDIWMQGNVISWTLFTWKVPIYSDRREDFETSQYISTLTVALPDNTLLANGKIGDGSTDYPLSFSNRIAGTARGGADDYPSQSITNGCTVRGGFVSYHGWMVRVPPRGLADERICAIVLKNLDQWTLHIDDLQSKDSGQ